METQENIDNKRQKLHKYNKCMKYEVLQLKLFSINFDQIHGIIFSEVLITQFTLYHCAILPNYQ